MNSEISTYTISVYELQDLNFDFGLNNYTIWNEAYRPILNKAIIDWYVFREIGYVNPNVWKQRLNSRLDLIMRNKYNALYIAKAKEFNPLYTMELYEDYTHTTTNTNTNETNSTTNATNNITSTNTSNITSNNDSETTSNGLALSSQFPSEEMMEADLTNNLFVDNANKNNGIETITDTTTQAATNNGTNTATNSGTDKTTNSGNNTTTESYNKKTYGSASDLSFAHAMQQFKDYCDSYDLDKQVIDELKDLFIQIW